MCVCSATQTVFAFSCLFVLGATRGHIDLFKAIRGARVDHFVVETNKLLIRLDKLMASDAPSSSDPKRRKGKSFYCDCTVWVTKCVHFIASVFKTLSLSLC